MGAALKATELEQRLSLSGPDGLIIDEQGMNSEKIDYMLELRASNNDIVAPFAEKSLSKILCR